VPTKLHFSNWPVLQLLLVALTLIVSPRFSSAQDLSVVDCLHSTGQASVTPMSFDVNCFLAVETDPASSADSLPTLLAREEGPYAVGDTIRMEFTQLIVEGYDPDMGNVLLELRPGYQSLGYVIVSAVDAEGNLTSGQARFNMFVRMEAPSQGMAGHTGALPVPLQGYVSSLPPVGAVLQMPPGTTSIPLYNEGTGAVEGRLCGVTCTVDSVCADTTISCCVCPTVGNVDESADCLVTMSDLTVLIDNLFITLTPLVCPEAGNVDQSPDGLITMSDLTVLIDNLFITLAPLPPCP
jgi:hypothetical protein